MTAGGLPAKQNKLCELCLQWWPKAERFGIPWKPMPRIKDMAAQASTPEGIQELEALYAEAVSWAGKQSQGVCTLGSQHPRASCAVCAHQGLL